MEFEIKKTEEEWKKILPPESYEVLREAGTERPFTGAFNLHQEVGTYKCLACSNLLFKSDTKFDSGCGWPSYFSVIEGAVIERPDHSHGRIRTEILCAKCGSHLGHVFNDGPPPTGLRYCINSVCLAFEEEEK